MPAVVMSLFIESARCILQTAERSTPKRGNTGSEAGRKDGPRHITASSGEHTAGTDQSGATRLWGEKIKPVNARSVRPAMRPGNLESVPACFSMRRQSRRFSDADGTDLKIGRSSERTWNVPKLRFGSIEHVGVIDANELL